MHAIPPVLFMLLTRRLGRLDVLGGDDEHEGPVDNREDHYHRVLAWRHVVAWVVLCTHTKIGHGKLL